MNEEILVPRPADGEESARPPAAEAYVEVEAAPAPSVGEQLRAAREAKGMSVPDVAKVLKLSVNQVVALEADDWSRLPGNTIIRGFVRNYARLFKLDSEPLMSALTALAMPQSAKLDLPAGSNTALPQIGKAERRDFATVFSSLVLVVLAVLVYFFMPADFWQSKLAEFLSGLKGSKATGAAVDTSTPNALSPQPAPGATTVEPAAQPDQPALAAAAIGADSQKVPASDSSGGLKLSFSQPSWVEIRDRSGQIIFSQLNPAGSQREIEGQPPFSLVVGNASNVTVHYKGQVVELLQRSKDDVARLNLD